MQCCVTEGMGHISNSDHNYAEKGFLKVKISLQNQPQPKFDFISLKSKECCIIVAIQDNPLNTASFLTLN